MANFHKHFKLNGKTFKTTEELLNYSKLLPDGIYNFLNNWFNSEKTISVKTSGSTDLSKNIKIKKDYLINSALLTGSFFNIKDGSTALMCLSPKYIAGKMMLVRAMVLGWNLDVIEAVLNPLITKPNKYDFCAMVPMQATSSINQLNNISTLIIGGGVISKTLNNMLQNVATSIYATYGMTETVTHIAVKKINTIHKEKYYSLLPNVTIKKDKRGCLIINAPSITDNKIITNDLVEIIDNNHFKWIGRFDNIINSGAIKLVPEQIEEKLSEVILNRFFVFGLPDELLGQKMILVIEGNILHDFPKIKNKKDLKAEFRKIKNITDYEIPKEIYFLSKFIETNTKKIQRKKTLDLIFR